jgi:hypothetical protein
MPKEAKRIFFSKKSQPDLMKYDAVGFEVENCLVKFDHVGLCKQLITGYLNELVTEFPTDYPMNITEFDFDKHLGLYFNEAVWDISLGTMLRLSEGKYITHALLGYEQLNKE